MPVSGLAAAASPLNYGLTAIFVSSAQGWEDCRLIYFADEMPLRVSDGEIVNIIIERHEPVRALEVSAIHSTAEEAVRAYR
jgi:hypothetical protein